MPIWSYGRWMSLDGWSVVQSMRGARRRQRLQSQVSQRGMTREEANRRRAKRSDIHVTDSMHQASLDRQIISPALTSCVGCPLPTPPPARLLAYPLPAPRVAATNFPILTAIYEPSATTTRTTKCNFIVLAASGRFMQIDARSRVRPRYARREEAGVDRGPSGAGRGRAVTGRRYARDAISIKLRRFFCSTLNARRRRTTINASLKSVGWRQRRTPTASTQGGGACHPHFCVRGHQGCYFLWGGTNYRRCEREIFRLKNSISFF